MLGIESLIEHFRVVFLSSIPTTFSGNALLKVYLYMKKYEGVRPSNGIEMFGLFGLSVWITGKKGKWIDFKMIADKPRVKANWYLKHNGERFSNNKDYKTLREYDPAIEERLSEILINSFDICEIEADSLK